MYKIRYASRGISLKRGFHRLYRYEEKICRYISVIGSKVLTKEYLVFAIKLQDSTEYDTWYPITWPKYIQLFEIIMCNGDMISVDSVEQICTKLMRKKKHKNVWLFWPHKLRF